MGSPPSELSLHYKPNGFPMSQKPFGDQPEPTQNNLEEFLVRLEEEKQKIEAFKRELPLCMELLNKAMETYRQQLDGYQANQEARPVLEEFMPLRNTGLSLSEKTSNASSEKANWMVSAQLWSPASDSPKQQPPTVPLKEADRVASPKLGLDPKPRNGGAFLPFSKERNKVSAATASLRALPELALASSEKPIDSKANPEAENGSPGVRRDSCNKTSGVEQGKGSTNNGTTDGQSGGQPHRKARRCWSPDLHRRFVNALQILGGSQVATPKQIRELMKVDGLTNDEVKSHLQKYRLHTRRPIPAPHAPATGAPQLVVLGGIWVPPEYATSAAAAAAAAPSIYGAHPAASHYCTAPMPQDFYPPPPPPLHHHQIHHQLHRAAVTCATTATAYKARLESPESDMRSGGDRSESIEEGEEGEDREEEEEDEDQEMEEKVADEKALLAVQLPEGNGDGDVALKF